MPRGSRARKKQKQSNPPPRQPEGETFDGLLGTVELDVPDAMARAARREALRNLMRRHIR